MESLMAYLKRISEERDRDRVRPFQDGMVLLVTEKPDRHVNSGKVLETAADHVTVLHQQPLQRGESVVVVSPGKEVFTEVVRTVDGKDGHTSELHILRRSA